MAESYELMQDEIDEAIRIELQKIDPQNGQKITRNDIKNIVTRVLTRCGIETRPGGAGIAHKGLIDRYHKGLFVAVRQPDKDGVHLYPLRPGSTVDILTDEGWQTVKVKVNPDADADPQALRVMLDVDDDTPVIGCFARVAGAIDTSNAAALPAAEENIKELEEAENNE